MKSLLPKRSVSRPLILAFSFQLSAFLPSPLLAQAEPATPATTNTPLILTPQPSPAPRINGPGVFGVRPGSPFFYSIPATGTRPMSFAAAGLPAGLKLDPATGLIIGVLNAKGEYPVTLSASNALGQTQKKFRIIVGDQIGLTPAMGWNSFNTYDVKVNQQQILDAAHAMIDMGLAQHGWSYVNCDDGWQGMRGGALNAIQPNEGFPDIAGMVKKIHALGLKAGIYSTPWVTSYGRRVGSSSDDPRGAWHPDFAYKNNNEHSQKFPFTIGKYHFAKQDAEQIAAWGFDYLKYDWAPIHAADVKEMSDALRTSDRDLIFSLSNNGLYTLFGEIAQVAPYANSWRITDDVHDQWVHIANSAFGHDAWAPYSTPGHFNDPDMLVIGTIGWGHPHTTGLTPDEQYTQISMWSLLSAPLILGCDLQKLDPFTLSLGKQALCVAKNGEQEVYAKPLEDGSLAVGLINRGPIEATVTANWSDLKLNGKQRIRNLWIQKDLGIFEKTFSSPVPSHGVVLLRLFPAS